MLRYITCLVITFSSLCGMASEQGAVTTIYNPYRKMANREAKKAMIKLNEYLTKTQAREVSRGIYSTAETREGEWQDFLGWILNTSGMGVNPITDLPKLKEAFMTFLLLCANSEKDFSASVSVISAIAVKYISWGACNWLVPMPASLVVPAYVCAPIGYIVGKYSGQYLGKVTYKAQCLDIVQATTTDASLSLYLNDFDYVKTLEWSELRNAIK